MANYWAITIGINQYRHLQPLMHAQNDALFMHRFFTETAGIPADNCILLSDLATSVGHQVVYPDKPALSEWVQTITQQVNADDVLWFFFSGYGVQQDGNDYLMPIDGDPGQIKETGLAAADLIETLAQLPTDKAMLVLDINRSQGALAGQAIGRQIISLAESHQLPLLLSCEPEQYSHETFGVRHGLFTAALLEALQQQCRTLGDIDAYVSQHLPELCEHHWRPIQNPVALMGDDQRKALVLPESLLVTDVSSTVVTSAEGASEDAPAVSNEVGHREDLVAMGASASGVDSASASTTVLAGSGGTLLAAAGASQALADTPTRQSSRKPAHNSSNDSALAVAEPGTIVPVGKSPSDSAVSGAKLRNWGLAALALLMVGVLLKQPFVRTAWVGLTGKIAALADRPDGETGELDTAAVVVEPVDVFVDDSVAASDPEVVDDLEADSAAEPDGAASEGSESDADAPDANADESDASDAESDVAETPDTDENAAADDQPETAADPTATAGDAADGTTPNVASAETKALLAEANSSLSQRQYSEALITLQQVPKNERDSAFASVLTKARAGAAEAQQFNASVLTDARTSIQPTQASQFSDAIAKARLIAPGEPYYDEAQQDIRSWSQIILDIAEGRATSGNLDGAIAAANVMPYDNSEFHQKAQDRIVFWQERQSSRAIIVSAQAIPRSGQASTYQQGIVKLREVPIEHPEYETAQRLADEWSDRIFSIAQARAAQGRRQAAIQAAVLVPAGTTSFEPTQQAIKRWRSEE